MPIEQFELVNEGTNEKLTLKQKSDESIELMYNWLLKRCPIGETAPLICRDCWLLVFDFLAPSQLGLEIALISRRFDFYVDEHFKTRKWKLNKQLLIQWDIQENGTKQMQIVKSDGNPLPIPQNPLPNKVIGFRRIQIIYIYQNIVAFLRRFHRRIFVVCTMNLYIITENVRILDFVLLNIWPMSGWCAEIAQMLCEFHSWSNGRQRWNSSKRDLLLLNPPVQCFGPSECAQSMRWRRQTGVQRRWHLAVHRVLEMEQNAPALSIQFDANAAAELHYLIAVHRAQELLGIDQLPPLILKQWPPLHVFGPSASAAVLCAVVSLFTNQLCRSDTAVTARVEFGNDELFGVGFLAQKAWSAREADLSSLVMSTADQDAWAAVPADVREGLTPVFVGTGRELLDAMFKPLPCAVQ
ncbi:hypothetical protein niasHT_036128 [Heterodera trifolii]|uniref:Lon proteolytic domain-containing protein n=1 Tax=Heterodera trifolii TaxID=157864 RepID=A0ABD2IQ19_9BILA